MAVAQGIIGVLGWHPAQKSDFSWKSAVFSILGGKSPKWVKIIRILVFYRKSLKKPMLFLVLQQHSARGREKSVLMWFPLIFSIFIVKTHFGRRGLFSLAFSTVLRPERARGGSLTGPRGSQKCYEFLGFSARGENPRNSLRFPHSGKSSEAEFNGAELFSGGRKNAMDS